MVSGPCFFLRLRRRRNRIAKPAIASTATPPTTLPAITPVLLGLGGEGGTVVVAAGELVDADVLVLPELGVVVTMAGIGPGFVLYIAVTVEVKDVVASQYIHVKGSDAPKDW